MANNNITFYTGTRTVYNSLATKDANGIYFVKDSGDAAGKIYKGTDPYGGDSISIASSSTLGGIKISDDFDIASDGTLSLYTPIKVTSFINNKSSNEIGSSVSIVTVNWDLNKVPTNLSIAAGSNVSWALSNLQSGSYSGTPSTPFTSTTILTLSATDSKNKTTTATSTIGFYYGKYYGVSTASSADSVNSTFVRGLTRQLTSSRAGSFTVNAGSGQYIWFAIPASWDTPSFYVGGFEGGFNKITTFDFTNASNNTTSYSVYRSTNANLGNTTVEVK